MIVLESKRLIFREHRIEDLDSYCAMEMDAHVRRYVGGYPRSRVDAERRFRDGPLRSTSSPLGVWAAVLKADGVYVGRSGLYPRVLTDGSVVEHEAVLSFYIALQFWGRGLATEAAIAFLRFGWEELKVRRVIATVQQGNDASVHILQKLGFGITETEIGPRTFLKFAIERPVSDKCG